MLRRNSQLCNEKRKAALLVLVATAMEKEPLPSTSVEEVYEETSEAA
jgi:hypothetical protein